MDYIDRMGELLAFNKIVTSPAEVTAANLSNHIEAFQAKNNLLVDGDAGPQTCWALQEKWAMAPANRFPMVRCPVDVWPPLNYPGVSLRGDAAQAFTKIRDDIRSHGGIVPSDGGKRDITTAANPSRSATSMHYPAIAFDLATQSGMRSPETDPFVIIRNPDSNAKPYWIVYARATQGEHKSLPAIKWNQNGQDGVVAVTGNFINFTELAKTHGFAPIKPRSGFFKETGRDYLSAEWWHFQYEKALIPGLSQFGIELLRIDYMKPDRIAAMAPDLWDSRKVVFGKNWG